MIICTINIDRLRKFDINRQRYAGFEIGQYISIPEDDYRIDELLYSNTVQITGFNIEHDIIHWKAVSSFGGFIHSGSHISDVKNYKNRMRFATTSQVVKNYKS